MKTLGERFWAKVDTSGGPGACWLWLGAIDATGYGRIQRGRRGSGVALTHRVAYQLSVSPIPIGLTLDHLCRNRGCVNPAHLEPVTTRVNLLRGATTTARHAAKTHCPSGHEYTQENTYSRPSGARMCRECKRARDRQRSRRGSPG